MTFIPVMNYSVIIQTGESMLKKHSGMTILEVMISLFLLTLMVGAVFPVFIVSRNMDLSSKAFNESKQLAQIEIENIYNDSQNLSYYDTLYQVATIDGFACVGFTWTVDAITGLITYNVSTATVTCSKTTAPYRIDLSFTRDITVINEYFVNISIKVYSTNQSEVIKRYETIYATSFNQ